jgi:hypothetical protein
MQVKTERDRRAFIRAALAYGYLSQERADLYLEGYDNELDTPAIREGWRRHIIGRLKETDIHGIMSEIDGEISDLNFQKRGRWGAQGFTVTHWRSDGTTVTTEMPPPPAGTKSE